MKSEQGCVFRINTRLFVLHFNVSICCVVFYYQRFNPDQSLVIERIVSFRGVTSSRVISSLSCDSFSLLNRMAGVSKMCALQIVLLLICRCTFSSTT